ncbi:hypothetical protein BE0216_05140 [Bifidobacterium eulemuris]|uniref:Uncharacterized protein n=1 Tax=Bifidobacterium eulemuris TaxID=1765219 RepID=A0A7L9SSE3_9BIFI|nr:hypothetical protein BE0216_05140 [Bifidobacterium eulemuris]
MDASSLASTVDGDGGEPLLARYIASLTLPSAWLEVAAQCPERFGEGAMFSARAELVQTSLAAKLGQDDSQQTRIARLDGVDSLAVDAQALLTMAQAEDRAGFAVEVLAARGISDADLATSDNHKTTAQQLVSLAGVEPNSDADPRQKAYAIDALIGDSGTVTDSATGLEVPVVAAVEMDCARTEAAAWSGTDAESAAILADLVAQHAYQAFQLGYPTGDFALFE